MIGEFFEAVTQFAFMRHALIVGMLAGIACGIVGTYVVARRITYIAGGIAQAGRGMYRGLSARSKSGMRSWQEASISAGDARRIQNAADKTGQRVTVVGSRAKGSARPDSDWDYIVSGKSRQRGAAKNSVPRGAAGGEIGPSGRETGIDWWQDYNRNAPNYMPLDPSRPHVIFDPQR